MDHRLANTVALRDILRNAHAERRLKLLLIDHAAHGEIEQLHVELAEVVKPRVGLGARIARIVNIGVRIGIIQKIDGQRSSRKLIAIDHKVV